MNQGLDPSTLRALQIPKQDTALPIDLTPESLIEKCEYFSSIGIWPSKVNLDPERWLGNFLPEEVEHAVYLLNAFIYFDSALVDQIFNTAIRTVGRWMTAEQWKEFFDTMVVTIVTGEEPSVTDSGHLFARKARSVGIPEERIINPQQANDLIQQGFDGPLVFVDDFVGSGNQFITTWQRPNLTQFDSFKDLAPIFRAQFYYCPAFCTEFGLQQIESECPEVTVSPGVFIPNNYGALNPDSVVWPTRLKSTSEE